jgi:hypothetical protein
VEIIHLGGHFNICGNVTVKGFILKFYISLGKYGPSEVRLSLVIAKIRLINHKMSLAVKDLKISFGLGKVHFSDKM